MPKRHRSIWLWLTLVCVLPGAASAQNPLASNVEATTVAAASPAGVAYDSAGNLYIAVLNDHVVRKVDTNGIITTVAGTGAQGFAGDGGTATAALLDSPTGVAVDGNNNIFIADSHNQRIREVSNGVISTIAGTGVAGFLGDAGPATAAQLNLPTAVSLDSTGSLYIADTNNQRIRRITAGTITTVAGTGEQGFSGDGQAALTALLDNPMGVVADPAQIGRFYIADTHNQRLRRVETTGIITTITGTGAAGFSGDGSAATAATLARPQGLAIDATGALYLADSNNQRIRQISAASVISTVAGDGEQGFAGDVGAATSALLDSPRAVAVSTGTGAARQTGIADTHNQRVRAVTTAINTVAGIAPPNTEGLLVSGPTTGTFGTTIGTLTALFTNNNRSATGSAVLTDFGAAIATQPFNGGSGNTAAFSLNTLAGGPHTLAVTYAGDANNPAIDSGVYLVTIAPTTQTVSFTAPASPVTYTPGLTVALTATASSGLPITFTSTGPAVVAGSTLTITGPGTVLITATQPGNASYLPASASQTIVVTPPLAVTGLTPSTVTLGTVNQPISLTGTGFTGTSVVLLNGTALPTAFVSSTVLTATIPQLLTLGPAAVTVTDTASKQSSAAITLTVVPSAVSATVTAPTTAASGQQPSITLQLQAAYPVALQGVFTLTFTPDPGSAVDDPAIQFSNGSRTFPFTLAAGATTTPSVVFQSGTVSGVITITLALTAQGVDVTPAAARTLTVTIPRQVPSATVTFTQSGSVLTLNVTGFSNVRTMTQAAFTFAGAPGTKLATTSLTLPVDGIFADWFGSAASNAYGSLFTYTQIFNLSDADTAVQSVTVTLMNSVGNSAIATSP